MTRSYGERGAVATDVARLVAVSLGVLFGLAACSGSSGRRAAPAPQTTTSIAPIPSTTQPAPVPGSSTTTPQTTGLRTVLSPIGLNLRAQPAKTAPVLATVARGAVLTVLGHSDAPGGWFQVKGATVTGWISDSVTLTAQGKLDPYQAAGGQFGALYPTGWTVAVSPPASVVFRAPAGDESIVVTTAANVGLLGAGRAGYQAAKSEQVLVCGITSNLRTYARGAVPATTVPSPGGVALGANLAQIRVTLDAQNALGVDANLADLSHLQTVRDFVNSVTFPYPQCRH